MPDTTPKDQRLMLIEAKLAAANTLKAAVNHASLKAQVDLAVRDLNEGIGWLQQENINDRPAILTIVDLAIGFADGRLLMVRKAFDTYGPDAVMLG